MTDRDDRRPPDDPKDEALDTFLNARARGNPSPRPELDGPLIETVYRLQHLADATLAANVSVADEARTWEALTRTRTTSRLVALPPTVAIGDSGPVFRLPVGTPVRPDNPDRPQLARVFPISRSAPPSRLRRFGSHSLGLVATLTLVALVGLSGLALYLSAPRPDGPGELPLLAGASPTAETAPADSQKIFNGPCDFAPRDYDQLMAMIADRILATDPVAPPPVASQSGPFGRAGPTYSLPVGSAVSPEIRTELVGVLGSWTNCNPFLQTALSTDDYLVRNALEGPSAGPMTFFWWLYSHPDEIPPAPTSVEEGVPPIPDPGEAELNPVGTSADVYVYSFRMLDEDHVAAYLASPLLEADGPGSVLVPVGPPRYEESSYVVFARQLDGRWLVDEWQFSRRSVDTSCYGACAMPVGP